MNKVASKQQDPSSQKGGFGVEQYNEFVNLFESKEDGHNVLMGIGQQMLTNRGVAKRLGMKYKAGTVPDGAEGEADGSADDDGERDKEFADLMDQLANGQEVGEGADEDEDGQADPSAKEPRRKKRRRAPKPNNQADGRSRGGGDWVDNGRGRGQGDGGNAGRKQSRLVDDIFGAESVAQLRADYADEYADAQKDGYADEYDDDEYDDEFDEYDDDYDDEYDDPDRLTLSSDDVGDGYSDGYHDDEFEELDFQEGEVFGIKEFAGAVSRQASKVASKAATKSATTEVRAQLGQVLEIMQNLVGRVESVERQTKKSARAAADQMEAIKEAVAGLESQYSELDQDLPRLATIGQLRASSRGKSADEFDDDGYDGYDDEFDETFVDPLVESTFGFFDSI